MNAHPLNPSMTCFAQPAVLAPGWDGSTPSPFPVGCFREWVTGSFAFLMKAV